MLRTRRSLALLLAVALAACPLAAAPLGRDAWVVAKDNGAFAVDLYGQLAAKPGNLFFSPYSISTALAMTYAGAKANTEAQMAKALHFNLAQDKLHAALQQVSGQLNADGAKRGYQLRVANALWGQQGYTFLDDFVKITDTNYDAGLRRVNFGAAEAARARINGWVEEKTNGKIKDLIPPGMLDALTRLVLTNAIYFKGDWLSQFDKAATRDEPFTLQSGKTVKAPTMRKTTEFRYMETPTFQAVDLPYVGYDLSMTIFLPRRKDGLPAFEKTLTADNLAEWLRSMRQPRKVILSLPKFKMTSSFRLKEVLMKLGMVDAFTRKADLSGMDGKPGYLFIEAVLHKAFVDVNEEGTEADTATAVRAATLCFIGPRPPVVFKADHPFLFVITHRRTDSILFMGRVANPKGTK